MNFKFLNIGLNALTANATKWALKTMFFIQRILLYLALSPFSLERLFLAPWPTQVSICILLHPIGLFTDTKVDILSDIESYYQNQFFLNLS